MGQSERVGWMRIRPLADDDEATLAREAKRRGLPLGSTARALLSEVCELLRSREQGADRN